MPAAHGTRAISADQMQALEAEAITDRGIPGFALMQRAAHGVIAALLKSRPDLSGSTAWTPVILAGPGNNGGDGFVIACQLAAMGLQPLVFSDPALKRSGDAARAEALWRDMATGPAILALERLAPSLDGPVILFDALFGTGLTRPLEGRWRAALDHAQGLPPERLVAVDMASGFHADSGRWLTQKTGEKPPLHYGLTVTFHAAKTGHYLAELGQASSRLAIADIGLKQDETGTALATISADLSKAAGHHKYDHGHAVIVAGPAGKGGAARLAARAALRIGAGLVTLACPPDALGENAARLDAVMLHSVASDAALQDWLAGDHRLKAVAIGPGLGLTEDAKRRVLTVLDAERPCVIDADALTLFADDPTALFSALNEHAVLTPHGGEFARLFPDLADEARHGNRLTATLAAAQRANAVVLLKGADSVIATPKGAAWLAPALYDQACPWLATAGAGDVLSGLIAGALARGLAPDVAACSAARLHQEAARRIGPGLIAEDLVEKASLMLPSN